MMSPLDLVNILLFFIMIASDVDCCMLFIFVVLCWIDLKIAHALRFSVNLHSVVIDVVALAASLQASGASVQKHDESY